MINNPDSQVQFRQKDVIHDNINDDSVCHYCSSTGLNERDKFCLNCRFPQKGTQLEKKHFLYSIKMKKETIVKKEKLVKRARIVLFVLAGLNLLIGIFVGLRINTDPLLFVGMMIGACIYFTLGMWSRVKPFQAILSAFYVFIVFASIAVIDDPHVVYKGLLFKIIIVTFLVYGYKAVKDLIPLREELKTLQKSINFKDDGM